MLVSVIIHGYNHAPYLRELIESVRNWNVLVWIVIIKLLIIIILIIEDK